MGEIEWWKLEVSGRVQMVNYRSRIQLLAEERGIVGQVWNDEKDEKLVHVEAQGSPQSLEEFIKAVGTPFGRAKPAGVKKVERLPPDPTLTDFDIKRSEVHLETLERMEVAGEVLGQLVVETKGVKGEVQSGFKGLSEEMRGGFKGLSEEMRGGFKGLSEEMRGGFKGLSEEMRGGFAGLGDKTDKGFAATNDSLKRLEVLLGTEMRTEMHQLMREVETLKTEMTEVKKQHLHAHPHSGPIPDTG